MNSHSDVYVPGLETSALTFSFTLYTRNRGARGTDNQGQIWTKSSELLHQGLSRTAWKMQKHHSASFCRWDHNYSYWRRTMTSGLLDHSVLILPFFGIWTPRTLEEQDRPDNRGGESEARLGGRVDLCPFYCSPADVNKTLCPDLLN